MANFIAKNVKVLPYSLPSVAPGADPGVQSQPTGDFKVIPQQLAAIIFCQACSHLPSQSTSPSFDQYQVILLGDRGTSV